VFDGGSIYYDMRNNYVQPRPYYDRQVQPVRYDQQDGGENRVQPKPDPYKNQGEYQKQVDKTWTKDHQVTNKDNYKDNLFGAAEKQKPVVMTFGRGSDPNCKQHLEAMEKAKQASGGKAEFTFVDLDKVDPNSAIGKYALNHIGKEYGTPLTMVFNQHQGENNRVIPERPTHYQRGHLDEQKLLQGIDQAAQVQKGREIKTGRDGSDNTPKPQPDKAQETAQKLVAESLKPWNEQKPDELFKGMEHKDKLKACWNAIELADKQNNPQLSAQVRAMVGFASIKWGGEAAQASNNDLANEHFMRGAEYMLSAGSKNPDIYKYPKFQEALRNSALPGNAADYLLEQGQKNAKWFFPTADEMRNDKNAYQKKREEYTGILGAEMKKPRVLRRPAA
jgi:hypothetical protein